MIGATGTKTQFDLAVIGAGIVGLAHAVEAVERGLSVIVIERSATQQGASVRNFGHGCITAQAGEALELALTTRERWIELSEKAGFWLKESGTVVAAREQDELNVLEEFAAGRGDQVRLLSASELLDRVPLNDKGLHGGAWFPLDIRVDPREAAKTIATWLEQRGVEFLWGTSAYQITSGTLLTSRGEIHSDRTIIAVGHDLNQFAPTTTEEAGIQRCTLQMLRIGSIGKTIEPAVLSGTSMLRYAGFATCSSLDTLRQRIANESPELLASGVNLMLTQTPNGDLIVGDTHHYGEDPLPFSDEQLDELTLREVRKLLGVTRLNVSQRWLGVYASSPGREFLTTTLGQNVHAVVITTGIGMSTAFGLAQRELSALLNSSATPEEIKA